MLVLDASNGSVYLNNACSITLTREQPVLRILNPFSHSRSASPEGILLEYKV